MLLTPNTMTLTKSKLPNKHKYLALFHINACSLNINFDDLDHLRKCTSKVFDIFTVTETRITNNPLLLLILAREIMPLSLPY